MRPAQLELEGTPVPVLRQQLVHARQGLHAANASLTDAQTMVNASQARVRSWKTSIDQIRAALRQLGELA